MCELASISETIRSMARQTEILSINAAITAITAITASPHHRITEHNTALDVGITELLDTAQYQGVIKQIVDRLHPVFEARAEVVDALIGRLRSGEMDTAPQDARATALADADLQAEAAHRDPEAAAAAASGQPGQPGQPG